MKKNKQLFVFSLSLFICFAAVAVALLCYKPKNQELSAAVESQLTSVTYEQSGNGFYYSGGTEIVYVSETREQSVILDMKDETGGEKISRLESIDGTNMHIAFAGNSTAFVLNEEETGLGICGTFSYSGEPLMMTNDGTELFVFYKVGSYCEVRVYELANMSSDYVRRGILYNYGGESEGVSLTLAKGLVLLSVSVVDDKLYVVHEGGLYKIDKSLALNSFKFLSEDERIAAGAVSYNKNSYDVVVAKEFFDRDILDIYTLSVSAGCYREADEKLYFITNGRKLKYYPIAELGSTEIGLELPLQEVADVVIQSNLTAKPVLEYDANNDKGYVYFDITNDLVCIDFATLSVEFTASTVYGITNTVVNKVGDSVFVLYADTNKDLKGERYITIIDVAKQSSKNAITTVMVICMVIAAILLIVTIFFALRTFRKGYDEKVKYTLKKMWKNKWVYVILLPSLAGLFMFCYYPGIASIILSFFDYTSQKQSMKWNNFANYIYVFTDKYSLEAFRNMLIFMATDILIALIPPLIFAFFLSFMRSKRYSNFTRTLLFIPGVIPGIASMLIWRTGIYGEYGVLNMIIKMFNGEPVKFLTSSGTALGSIIMMGFPFVGSYLIFYGAIMNIADSYIEAAELEGCPLLKRIWHIDLPLIMPQIKYVLIMALIQTTQNFNRVYMTTGGSWGTQIPINTMYNQLLSGNYGVSSAYAMVLFCIMFIPMIINLRTQKKGME